MLVLDYATVIAQLHNRIGKFRGIRDDGASISVGTEILARVKARRRGPSEASRPQTVLFCALSLRRILDNAKTVLVRDTRYLGHRRELSVQVYRNNGLRPLGDARLDQGRIHQQE